jgi:hypothetical protein
MSNLIGMGGKGMDKQFDLISNISKIEYEVEILMKQKRELQKERVQCYIETCIEQIRQLVVENSLTDRNLKLLLMDFADMVKNTYEIKN